MTPFNMVRDVNGFNGFGLTPSDDMADTTLAANVAQTFTVPTTAAFYIAIFSIDPGLRVFARYDGSAAVLPSGSVVTTNKSELNPVGRKLQGGSTFSCITPDASAYVQVSYYAVQ